MDDEFELSDEKLDELFVKQVGSVAELVEKMPDNDAIMSTCTRWLKIFQQAKADEKFERNCLLLLLHQQLNDHSVLSYPFTDERSSQRNLRTLHQMMRMSDINDNNENCESFHSVEYTNAPGSACFLADSCEDSQVVSLETFNQQLIEENKTLASELLTLQLEKENLQQQRKILRGNVDTVLTHNEMFEKEIDYFKGIFSISAFTSLAVLKTKPKHGSPPNYFATVFSVLCENERDAKQCKKLDAHLGRLVRANIDNNLHLAMRDYMSTVYEDVLEKVNKEYQNSLQAQEEDQRTVLGLTGTRCLMLLHNLIIDSFKGNMNERNKVLNFLLNCHNRFGARA